MPLGELRIVKTCMVAQRAAIEVVAQNIANAATPCYTRQRPVLTPIAATQMVDPTKAGQGVSLDYVQRLTDTRLQARINLQRGMYQQAQTLSFGLERIEGVVGDMDEGMQSALTDFFNAWDDLGADGNNLGARARVVSTGQALADALHAHRATLQSLAGDIEGQFNDLVARANALLERVAELNKQAMGNEGRMGGNMAAVQRDQACQELAELLGATTLAQPDGSLSVLISGLQVVDAGTASRVELVADPADPSIHHLSIQGHVDPGVSESWLSPTLGQVQGITGQALALLQIRDQYMPAYLQRLDEFAGVLAEAVNTRHQLGFDLNGDPGGVFFEYDPTGPAGSLQVSATIAADSRLTAASGVANTSGDGQAAFAIGAIRYERLFGIATAEQYVADLMAQAGADVVAAQDAAVTRENLLQALEDRFQERYGVSVDEESVELMKYQKAFIAATRVAEVVNEMMESVLDLV